MVRRALTLSLDDECITCGGEGFITIELVGQGGFQDVRILCDGCVEGPPKQWVDAVEGSVLSPKVQVLALPEEVSIYCPNCGEASFMTISGPTCTAGHGGLEGVTWAQWVKIRDARKT